MQAIWAVETILFCGILGAHTLVLKAKFDEKDERSWERITDMPGTSTNVTKKLLSPIPVKYESVHCSKAMKHLSCQFKSNNNALVTGKLFCD
jgi:hypothetical protein